MNNKVITKDEQIKIGKNILSTYMECPEESLTITELTEDNTIYISQPIRGGGSIIVASDGSYLFFNSSISFDEALEEFRKGRRIQGKRRQYRHLRQPADAGKRTGDAECRKDDPGQPPCRGMRQYAHAVQRHHPADPGRGLI